MIFITNQTEFTNCKRVLSISAGIGGTACGRVRHTGTYDVIKEVSGVATEDAIGLYEKLPNLYAKCENRKMPCCTR